ncbi:nitroreductase family deazaflavin-dependent oxidoreductase [Nocardia sp. NPDC051911]|uniref:nitroreductase family deazaflavin-dependent oxidoreductase n=1 Tax=Nocardia sp. NPDC051911 TaxID=3154648 RepID=UPI0034274DB8
MPLDGRYESSPIPSVRAQVELYVRTNGRQGYLQPDTGLPIALFTIRGRRTGALRRVPLMRVISGGNYLLVASSGGSERYPAWYHNLIANPEIEIQDGPEVFGARARLLSGSERRAWWRIAVAAFPYYADYQAGTRRDIPICLAERL